jgi:hypothetical protein
MMLSMDVIAAATSLTETDTMLGFLPLSSITGSQNVAALLSSLKNF